MDNQLILPKTSVQRVVIIIMAITLTIFLIILSIYTYQISDPYLKNVLSLQGDSQQGQAIFQINCAGCHGLQGEGNIGPSLNKIHQRKSKIRLIKQVTSGKTPPMPEFQPTPQEMADLLTYLETL